MVLVFVAILLTTGSWMHLRPGMFKVDDLKALSIGPSQTWGQLLICGRRARE